MVEGVSLEGAHPSKAVGGVGLEPGDGGGEGEEGGGEAHSQVLGIHLRGREGGKERERRAHRRRERGRRRLECFRRESTSQDVLLSRADRGRCIAVCADSSW